MTNIWRGGCVAVLVLVASCTSYIPFTNHLRNQFHLEGDALRGVQFYTSNSFSLRRDITVEGGKPTVGGVVRMDDGRLIEEVYVRKHTPGVALAGVFTAEPPRSALQLSFMPGDNVNSLVFATPEGELPDSDAPFLLNATQFEGPVPKVKYDNKLWTLDLSKKPVLMIRKAAFFKLKRIIRILPGRVVAPVKP